MTEPQHRKVLITGAGGFIGSHLVRDQLARGCRVVATDLNVDSLRSGVQGRPDLFVEQADLRDTDRIAGLLSGIDVVFHLGAAHLDVLAEESYFEDVNVRATRDLYSAASEAGVRRFVHCSSVGVLGRPRHLPADERSPPAPEIAYERTKLGGERALGEASRSARTELVILRPAWVYGPGCQRTLKLIRAISRRRFFFAGKADNLRHPIYIADMLLALEIAATHPAASGEIFIIAGARPVTIEQLVGEIIDGLQMDYRPVRVPFPLAATACSVLEIVAKALRREPPFSRRSLKFFSDSAAFDGTKAKEALGFVPLVELREGLKRTIDHYREAGVLSGRP